MVVLVDLVPLAGGLPGDGRLTLPMLPMAMATPGLADPPLGLYTDQGGGAEDMLLGGKLNVRDVEEDWRRSNSSGESRIGGGGTVCSR